MAKDESTAEQSAQAAQDDDEPDDWDKRIYSTGCADENAKLTDCYYEKKDWRECKKEIGAEFPEQMEVFRECWKRHNNDERTSTRDA
ncbi:hypothetical protein F5X96DRAFT_669857 [Biscogniauxia mediterranea]|nr:hypothetical protein F5X96DRAFT_669857 [Biscogniauxia mediterranea]